MGFGQNISAFDGQAKPKNLRCALQSSGRSWEVLSKRFGLRRALLREFIDSPVLMYLAGFLGLLGRLALVLVTAELGHEETSLAR